MVAAETVARVVDAARHLGYTTNAMARGLRTNRTFTIGVIIPDLINPVFPPIIRGLQDALLGRGYSVLIADTDNDVEKEDSYFRALVARNVDGLVIATARSTDTVVDNARELGFPVVLVNRTNGDGRFPLAAGNDRDGINAAVTHLSNLGHRYIGHLAGPEGVSTAAVRLSAFREAIAARSLPSEISRIVICEGFSDRGGTIAANKLLDDHPETTAIIAGNDLIALGALRALSARGLRCPHDISVVGFNDMYFADALSPPLTTVHVPYQSMGTEAAHLLIERLENPDSIAKSVLLPLHLVVRDSTGAVRSKASRSAQRSPDPSRASRAVSKRPA
jgi:LacI family transcriptional regulator